jgi:hypothetical protein
LIAKFNEINHEEDVAAESWSISIIISETEQGTIIVPANKSCVEIVKLIRDHFHVADDKNYGLCLLTGIFKRYFYLKLFA